MKITFVLDKQTIRRTDSNTVVAGSRDYLYAHFALASPDWIAPITAIFGNKTVILNDDGDCKVPWEVIEHPGAFSVSAFCVSVHTAQGVIVPVEETPYDPGETPPDPSPDVYTQLTQMVQEALDTANSVREDANAGEFNGAPGPVGPYYEPDLNDAGDISWENNGGLPNPPTKNIKGPKGDAATIEIAGTETGNPGTDASVVNEGTKGDAKFRFTIPRGDEGKAATIEVGEVTASDPGSEPQVTNTGTENAAVLDFVLPRGQTGPTGQAATVEVESTITGQPGTQASVENVGTTGEAKLRFTIPQGAQGVPGQDAPAPKLTVGDVETVSPDTPADAEITGESPNFVLGLKIPQGETGATPNITAGEVEKLDPDQDPTASITGETPNLVLNLGIPQGQPGQDGVQINDEAVSSTETWSSKKLLDTLCPPFTEEGNPVTCTPVEDYPLDVTVTMEPIQEGEGDPSPDNVRPISGRDSVQVTRCGKNLLNPENVAPISGYYGLTVTYEDGNIFHIAGKPNNPDNENLSFVVAETLDYSLSGKGLVITVFSLSGNLTVVNAYGLRTSTEKSIAITAYLDNTVTYDARIQLAIGEENLTAYAPYQGDTYTLTLPETIYGGEVDAVTGVGSKEWGYIASYNGEPLPAEWISDQDVYAAGTTPTTGAQVAYKLATPEPFQATGSQPIPALAGENTVYTDGDSLTVSGRTNPLSTIQTMRAQITALQDQVTQGGTA